MDYSDWRAELFGQPSHLDPISLELKNEIYDLDANVSLDMIDRALDDESIHEEFSTEQIGIGLNLIYSNCCCDLPHLYVEGASEQRRIAATRNLTKLTTNFFDRYCTWPVTSIGNDLGPKDRHLIGYMCYMFWDIFVMHPGDTTQLIKGAALHVMSSGLQSTNDNSIVSAIHGLGHWALEMPKAKKMLQQWLMHPTTTNSKVLSYAMAATTGMIQ